MTFRNAQDDPRLGDTEAQARGTIGHTMPSVAQRPGSDRLGLMAGMMGALLLGYVTYDLMAEQRTPATGALAEPSTTSAVDNEPQQEAESNAQLPIRQEPIVPQPVPDPPVDPLAARKARDRARAPTLLVDLSVTRAPAQTGTATQPETSKAAPGKAADMTSSEAFALRVSSHSYDTARASRLDHLDTLVAQGTIIPGVLETGVNSDLPGYARALISQDVRSFDGSRILIPRGTRLIGQYKSGLANGQTRAYILWTRLLRPDGVSVDIASPAVDESGQAGLTGDVNSHFFKRFGSAILMTIVGGASAALGDSADVVIGASNSASSAASVALKQDILIPPTITIPPGQAIRVITARDLDFSGVEERAAQ